MSSNRYHQGQSGSARRRANPTQPQTTRYASTLLGRLSNLEKIFTYRCTEKESQELKLKDAVDTLRSAQHRLSNRRSDQDIFNLVTEYRKAVTNFEDELKLVRALTKNLARIAQEQQSMLKDIAKEQSRLSSQQEDN
ncbi:hypothetical protein FVEG_13616 [Fusarium verticillioides 7600]|uniref:Uncharacterized protein n=1 Tax=Gibberella moniliformis (strain M3125 / FGSC 7600) TaxID=334819 RepID=W7N6D9_GIBM7|nr:hypothetical protein FVEG_13616 [Fusarium verticillioides 7600]EWG55645.1 hypothetical protein FVEG_13616 [Fusarium verticillioides 7600]